MSTPSDPGRPPDPPTTDASGSAGPLDAARRERAAGRLGAAAEICRTLLAADPRDVGALRLLGDMARESGRLAQAAELIGAAMAIDGGVAADHAARGAALIGLGRPAEAAADYRRAIELDAGDAAAHAGLGQALRLLDQDAAALACYDDAARLAGRSSELPAVHRAVLLMELGRVADAQRSLEEAIAINPASAAAWLIRGDLKHYAPGDPDLVRLEALLAAPGSSLSERVLLRFALAKAWMDAGDDDRAFLHLEEGNRLERSTFAYDADATDRALAAIRDAFTPELLRRFAGAGHPSEVPVFVVGMPRSGTSLVEQILASHPSVHGAGELTVLPDLVRRLCGPHLHPLEFPGLLATLEPAVLARLGAEYVGAITARAPGRARVVDKMPDNFLYAGLVRLMLPNARIVHCRRDAVDTCLSCYLRKFDAEMSFAYDQRELGRFYRSYRALTDHWRRLLPRDRFLDVDYERVVEHLEPEARRLIAFCGLDWDDRCLRYETTARAVRTASATQVRLPPYGTAIGRGKRVARHLGPLLDALGGGR